MKPSNRVVLVTGAGGFIGGRVVELLQDSGRFEVVPALRRWSTAARIGRYPLDFLQCDLLQPDEVASAVRGVGIIVHCAVGDRAATVDGTRNLLAAALEAGVGRVIHLSTVDVYGPLEGEVTEDLGPIPTGREYGDSKIEAEQLCREFSDKGLQIVVLRPTIVYGPFSDEWTTGFARRFAVGDWFLPRSACDGSCNLLYVDDLVHCIRLAMDAPQAPGHAFNVNGPDRVTWQDYFDALARAIGCEPLPSRSPAGSKVFAAAAAPVRAMVKATYVAFQDPILRLYKRSALARRFMKSVERGIRSAPSRAEFQLYGRKVHFPNHKAREVLRYEPQIDMARGVALSAEWLQHEGVVPPSGV